jgi:hypothetical protein
MRKELTDKMREEIVKAQINFIQKNHPYFLTGNGELLQEYLTEGLNEYSSEIVSVNSKVDMKLLESLQDGNKTTASKLINAAMINNFLIKAGREIIDFDETNFDESIKDRHLVALYKKDEHARRYIVNYGPKTSKLLSDYLTKRGLIE